jgi:hypothetical protein
MYATYPTFPRWINGRKVRFCGSAARQIESELAAIEI